MGRGAWYSFGAVLAYFISACCFIMMKDYPGVSPSDDDEPAVMVVEAAELDKPEEEGDEEVGEAADAADEVQKEEGETPVPDNADAQVEDPSMGEPKQSIAE